MLWTGVIIFVSLYYFFLFVCSFLLLFFFFSINLGPIIFSTWSTFRLYTCLNVYVYDIALLRVFLITINILLNLLFKQNMSYGYPLNARRGLKNHVPEKENKCRHHHS